MLYQTVVCLRIAHIELGPTVSTGRGHHDGCLRQSRKKIAVKGWGEVEKNSLVAHLLQLLVGYAVAMLNRIRASVNCGLNAAPGVGVDGDFQILAMSFFDDRFHLRDCGVILNGDFDDVDVIKKVVFHSLPGLVYSGKP